MNSQKLLVHSAHLTSENPSYALFRDVSRSFGYEIAQIKNISNIERCMRDREIAAFFVDASVLETPKGASILKELGKNKAFFERFTTVLLIPDVSYSAKPLKRTDCILILSLPEKLFELALFSIMKYIWQKKKADALAGVTDPDFIKRLLSDTAHEVNNILTGMQGYAELAQLNPDDEKLVGDSFQVVIDSSYRIRNEIKNLRAFARVENPLVDTINIGEVIGESAALAKSQLEAKKIKLATRFDNSYLLNGDYDQLVQVFFNLINDVVCNCREKCAVEIALSGQEDQAFVRISGTEYEVKSEDFKDLERIFEFEEPVITAGNKEGRRENRNILSLCNRIVHNHRGDVSVERKDENTVLYTVRLPFKEMQSSPQVVEEAKVRRAYESIENLDMDILIVDDEEYVRNTIYYFFDRKGCRVTLAEDGEYGLSVAKDKPFDLIFMDYLMPKMGGIEAARKIRESNSEVKIVFITGRDAIDEDALRRSGVYACIKKPFEMKELFDIARRVALEKGMIE